MHQVENEDPANPLFHDHAVQGDRIRRIFAHLEDCLHTLGSLFQILEVAPNFWDTFFSSFKAMR
jgi:hypothetical protein